MRPNPPANDEPGEVLLATEPHEGSTLGAIGTFLIRHRRAAIALLTVASCVLILFAWTLANGDELHGKVIALGDAVLDVPGFYVRGGRSGSHRIGGWGSSGRGSHYVGGSSSARSHSGTSRSYGTSSHAPPRASTSRATTRSTGHHAGTTRDAKGRIKRDPAARAAFQRSHPCPSTGRRSGACPGYVVDHVTPLKRGGADQPSNLQWQTTQAAKQKDKTE